MKAESYFVMEPGPCLCGHGAAIAHVLTHHTPLAFGRRCERFGCGCPGFLPYLMPVLPITHSRQAKPWPLEPLVAAYYPGVVP